MDRPTLLARLARKLESPEILGYGIGAGEQVIDFLARLEMEAVELLLCTSLSPDERESVLNWVEERKGQLPDQELPLSEVERRSDLRRAIRRGRGIRLRRPG